MKKNSEFFLDLAADSNEIIQDDKLAKMISEQDEDELSEDELYGVSAAAKPDFEKLAKILKDRNIEK